jgi:hypothetical protein
VTKDRAEVEVQKVRELFAQRRTLADVCVALRRDRKQLQHWLAQPDHHESH